MMIGVFHSAQDSFTGQIRTLDAPVTKQAIGTPARC